MANSEHVKILRRGAKIWNQWRGKNEDVRPDLSGANLRNTDLTAADLRFADLIAADLSKDRLIAADLSGANLTNANLYNADLTNANLSVADLTDADLRLAVLHLADLRSANLRNTKLTNAKLFATSRDSWRIEGVKCDYVYWGINEERTPKDRDFLPGEFEELYKWRSLDDFEKLIKRSIEFPAEYKQAGTSILNYFSEILHKKYPEANATVQIKQDGLKVTMIIDPVDGEREIIEKVLNEYGLVVTGKMTPEEFTEDRLLIIELKSELRAARDKIEMQKELLQFQNEEIKKKDIQIERFLNIMESAMQRPVNIEIKQENANHFRTNNIKDANIGGVGDNGKVGGGIHFNNNED